MGASLYFYFLIIFSFLFFSRISSIDERKFRRKWGKNITGADLDVRRNMHEGSYVLVNWSLETKS